MTITSVQYFGGKNAPVGHRVTADILLQKVNQLCYLAAQDGCYDYWIDPDTGTQISGSKGGSGDGGYRLPDSTTGGPKSPHRAGAGIDVYDPQRKFAQWCVKNKAKLRELGLYCEDFRWTPNWCHFQSIPPISNRVIYIPYSDMKKNPPLAPALEGQDPLPFIIKA